MEEDAAAVEEDVPRQPVAINAAIASVSLDDDAVIARKKLVQRTPPSSDPGSWSSLRMNFPHDPESYGLNLMHLICWVLGRRHDRYPPKEIEQFSEHSALAPTGRLIDYAINADERARRMGHALVNRMLDPCVLRSCVRKRQSPPDEQQSPTTEVSLFEDPERVSEAAVYASTVCREEDADLPAAAARIGMGDEVAWNRITSSPGALMLAPYLVGALSYDQHTG